MGPSRKILHARGVGSERRKRVTRLGGSWGALGATRKIKFYSGNSLSWQLQAPLFLAARMRIVLAIPFFSGQRKWWFLFKKEHCSKHNPKDCLLLCLIVWLKDWCIIRNIMLKLFGICWHMIVFGCILIWFIRMGHIWMRLISDDINIESAEKWMHAHFISDGIWKKVNIIKGTFSIKTWAHTQRAHTVNSTSWKSAHNYV